MFSGQIIIEILKMMKKCKINFKKCPGKSDPPGIRQKIGSRDLAVFNNFLGGFKAWN